MESVTRTTWKTGDGQEFFEEDQAAAHEAELERRAAKDAAQAALKAKFKVRDVGGALYAVLGGNLSQTWAFLADCKDEQEFRDFFHLLPDRPVDPGWNFITVDYNDASARASINSKGRCDIERELKAALEEVQGM